MEQGALESRGRKVGVSSLSEVEATHLGLVASEGSDAILLIMQVQKQYFSAKFAARLNDLFLNICC